METTLDLIGEGLLKRGWTEADVEQFLHVMQRCLDYGCRMDAALAAAIEDARLQRRGAWRKGSTEKVCESCGRRWVPTNTDAEAQQKFRERFGEDEVAMREVEEEGPAVLCYSCAQLFFDWLEKGEK